ncbi:MAG TPA: hypothetical protein VN602_13015, partial [Gemmatimonadaceae bacterium]|nr:hypothetical protein [Gemmatimonadaceae bacterium]
MRFIARSVAVAAVLVASTAVSLTAQQAPGLASTDISALRGLGDVQVSPDGRHVAYAVTRRDAPGRPRSETWIRDLATHAESRLGTDATGASSPRWSPDGSAVAFFGRVGDSSGVAIAKADGSDIRFIASVKGTNHVLPSVGERLSWSPDGHRLAFVSSTPGPESDANGDPMVITRYSYKPTASEGLTRFNDNRRLHIFVADLATKHVTQLTTGNYYEHSIEWSPSGAEIMFVSNHGADPDRVFNYDVFAVNVASGAQRQITKTASPEYQPVWSPDGRRIAYLGTKRSLTSSETTMEDTHVWVMSADGSNRREVGISVDNRQRAPRWSRDGTSLYTVVQVHGDSKLYRIPVDGGSPHVVVGDEGQIGSWSLMSDGGLIYAFASPSEPAMLREMNASGVA